MVTGARYPVLSDEADQFLYHVTKVDGRCFNGVVYADRISKISRSNRQYTLKLKDLELQKYLVRVNAIHRKRQMGEDMSLMVLFYWDKSGKSLARWTARRCWCHSDVLNQMLEQQILRVNQDGELQKGVLPKERGQ